MSASQVQSERNRRTAESGRSVCLCGSVAVKWKHGPCCERCDRIETERVKMEMRQGSGRNVQYIEPYRFHGIE